MNELKIFEGHNVEIIDYKGKALFNPYHVGECLDLTESAVRKAITGMNNNQVVKLTNSKVKDSNFRKLHNTGENFLTESGVYKLVFRSNKPNAEQFADWVADDVLPSIRKEGAYITDKAEPEILRNKADELENLTTLNETANILLPVLENAGLKPQYKAIALKQIYKKAGIDIHVEELTADREIFDNTAIASKVGIYSSSNKPHGQAVGAIISKLTIADEEKELVTYERNGHTGTTTQYTESVIGKVSQWIIDNNYPNEINCKTSTTKSKTYHVEYNNFKGKDLLTPEEYARYANVCVHTVYRKAKLYEEGKEGGLPCKRIGRNIRIPKNALELAEQQSKNEDVFYQVFGKRKGQ